MTYDNPHAFIHDLVNEKIPLQAVTLQQWVHGTSMAMITQNQPELNVQVQYKGGIYSFHHCITQINPPMSDTKQVLETVQ